MSVIDTRSNIVFMFENSIDTATLAASSEASADLAVENLQTDSRADQLWRSSSGGPGVTAYVDITLAYIGDPADEEVAPVAMLAIVDLNVSSEATIRVQGWAAGIATGTAEVDMTVDVFSAATGFGVGGFGSGSGFGGGIPQSIVTLMRPIALIYLGAYHQLRYWRVTVTCPTSTYIQASRMYLGNYWQPENNYARGALRELVDRTPVLESVGGQEYGDDRRHRVVISAVTKGLPEADSDYLWTQFLRFKRSKPFLVCYRPTNRLEQLYLTLWARFDSNRVLHQSFDNYDADLNVREWL